MTARRRLLATAIAGTAVLASLAGCATTEDVPTAQASSAGTTPSSESTTSTPSPRHPHRLSPSPVEPFAAAVQKVLVVVEENHSFPQMRRDMPFLARVSSQYGYATHWTALSHPSLPNYLGMTAGTTFDIHDDRPPAAHTDDIGSALSVFDQAIDAGKSAGTYAESMPENCFLDDFPDPSVRRSTYAVRHNPWTYFTAHRSTCLDQDRDLSRFIGDAVDNALPNVGFLIPDLGHDAHDGSLTLADSWLEHELAPVMKSTDFTSGRLVVVVTADEDDKHSDNWVLTSVLTPRVSHAVVSAPLTHYSITRFLAQVLGVEPLRRGATAPDMRGAFGL